MSQIKINIGEIINEISSLKETLDSLLLENASDNVIDSFFTLLDSLSLNVVILPTGTAAITNDHIIRLGVSGDFKVRASALTTFKRDLITH